MIHIKKSEKRIPSQNSDEDGRACANWNHHNLQGHLSPCCSHCNVSPILGLQTNQDGFSSRVVTIIAYLKNSIDGLILDDDFQEGQNLDEVLECGEGRDKRDGNHVKQNGHEHSTVDQELSNHSGIHMCCQIAPHHLPGLRSRKHLPLHGIRSMHHLQTNDRGKQQIEQLCRPQSHPRHEVT